MINVDAKKVTLKTKPNLLFNLKGSAKDLVKCIKRDKYLYLLLIPFLAFFIVFQYLPMYGLQIAFKDYSLFTGIENSPWVGLENFKQFFTGPFIYRVVKNTILLSGYSIAIGFPIPIILALLFNEVINKRFKMAAQTLTYLPHFVSVVVVAGIVTNFLSPSTGLINIVIEMFGGQKTYFLVKPEYFRSIYVSMTVWKEAGFNAIIYIAAISAIDITQYEAAVVDGANKWKQLWNVTIPGILPTIAIMLILRIGSLLEVGYESIILLYRPATYETADVISTYVYRSGLIETNYSLAAAVGLFNSVIALVLVVIANRISKKISEVGIW